MALFICRPVFLSLLVIMAANCCLVFALSTMLLGIDLSLPFEGVNLWDCSDFLLSSVTMLLLSSWISRESVMEPNSESENDCRKSSGVVPLLLSLLLGSVSSVFFVAWKCCEGSLGEGCLD